MYSAGPSSFCANPRTVVGPPANSRSCGGTYKAALENCNVLPTTAPICNRPASTRSLVTGRYIAAPTVSLVNRSDGSDPVKLPAVRNSNRSTLPVVGSTGLSLVSRVTASPTTPRRCRRLKDSRSASTQALNTAQSSAGCACVSPYSSEYDNCCVTCDSRRVRAKLPPTGVVRRYALYSDRRSL